MTTIAFILLVGSLQAACSYCIRYMQANSRNVYAAIVASYAVAFPCALAYALWMGSFADWERALLVGIGGGFFYTAALIAIIRTMNQRGLAMTSAFAGLALAMPILIAIAWGETPSKLQAAGIIIAGAAIPLLAISTTTGMAIRERPKALLVALLFLLQGCAMSSNYIASKVVEGESIPLYLSTLYAFGLILSLFLAAVRRGPSAGRDVGIGAVFGFLNFVCTLAILIALRYVVGSIFYAGIGVLCLTCCTLLALIFWRERLQRWGWIGLGLAAMSIVFLNLNAR